MPNLCLTAHYKGVIILNTNEALTYTGVSKPTFLKFKVPYSPGVKKGWKLYNIKILDEYFPDSPKIMPSPEPTAKTVSLEVMPSEFRFVQSDHVQTFKSIQNIVKTIKGAAFSKAATGSLIESLIKVDELEIYYFKQLVLTPDSVEIFRCYNATVATKIALTKKLGL